MSGIQTPLFLQQLAATLLEVSMQQYMIGMIIFLSGLLLSPSTYLVYSVSECFRSQEILIRAGKSHVLNVIPTKHYATSNFMELDKEDRKCALRTEVDDGALFNHYSQKGCIFECILKTMVQISIYFIN